MSFNIFHYLVIAFTLLILLLGIVSALRQSNKKLIMPIIFSSFLVSALIAAIGIAVVEKYTKKVKLVKIDNKRYLSTERISYFGFVKNVGKFPIGKVYLKIKIVNGGHNINKKIKPGTFFQSSGFFDFFSSGANKLYKPQQIEKEFIIAQNLKPAEVVPFRVTFRYPPYFSGAADFIKVYGH